MLLLSIYLGVPVDKILKVFIWLQHSFVDKMFKVHTDGGSQGSLVGVGQPRQFLCVLVVRVLQVQPSLYLVDTAAGRPVCRECVCACAYNDWALFLPATGVVA